MPKIQVIILAVLVASLGQLGAAENVAAATGGGPKSLYVGLSESTVLEDAAGVKRISVANPDLVEIVAVNRHEILLNGKTAGSTSMVLWDMTGRRSSYQLYVGNSAAKSQLVRDAIRKELPNQDITFESVEGTVVLRGVASDLTSADRAVALASTLGKVVNLLNVKVPETDPQILLKVRFANVNRTAASQLGFNAGAAGYGNTSVGGSSGTGQFGAPINPLTPSTSSLSDVLNFFLARNNLNLAATVKALENKQLLQILAEPNLLTVSGRPASFLAGGEFPFPTLQGGGSGVGQITVQFREFGIRIHFIPTVTPRGTIRLAVTPEVSSLDYSNSLTVGGITIPGLSTRRVQSEVELENGQSFVIAGLLDNRTTETLNKIPGLANIPVLGKLFESRAIQKNNSELMVLVTPELVQPIPSGAATPDVKMQSPFLKNAPMQAPVHPVRSSGKLPVSGTLPVEVIKSMFEGDGSDSNAPHPAIPAMPLLPPGVSGQPASGQQAAPSTNTVAAASKGAK